MPPEWIHSNEVTEAASPTVSENCPAHANVGLGDANSQELAEALTTAIGEPRYAKWFAGRTTFQVAGDVLTIGVSSPFMIKFMVREFREIAHTVARELLGLSAQVRFEVDDQATALSAQSAPQTLKQTAAMVRSMEGNPSAAPRNGSASSVTATGVGVIAGVVGGVNGSNSTVVTPSPLSPAPRRRRFARLDDFVPGQGNQIALTMAQTVAEHPGEKYNPLYLYGTVGVGKTHLLEGIHAAIRERYPELTVTYLTAESFANYYTKALREKTQPAFRRKFRSMDALIVDDIDFLDAKKGIQEEFCHTIQDLLSYGRQVVLAADRHPKMLPNIRPELCSRFLSGLVTRLEAPDETNRLDILRRQSALLGLPMNEEAMNYIARKFSRNVRELLGAVNSLRNHYQTTGSPLTLTATRDALRDFERDCLRIVRAADIQQAVCELFGVQQPDLISARRTRQLSQPRMLAMYLTRQWTNAAYHEIGKQFGGRNHSTVMSAEKKMKDLLQRNTPIQISTRQWSAREIVAMLEEQLQVG